MKREQLRYEATKRREEENDWFPSGNVFMVVTLGKQFDDGYDAALALAQPLVEALETVLNNLTSKEFSFGEDRPARDRIEQALAAYRAALGSPVK